MDNELFEKLPPRIRILLRKARSFQIGLEELYDGKNPARRRITADLSFQPTDDVQLIAESVRDYLNVPLETQFSWTDEDAALDAWRDALTAVGVYVFKDQFRANEFMGFCLYDQEFPIIYINNTTAKTRQIFSIFHELAHLLFRTSGIDKEDDSYIDELSENNRRIEVICNKLAAHILVPDDVLDNQLDKHAPKEGEAARLARKFSVSRESIYRRFLERNLVSQTEYNDAARRWSAQTKQTKGGGNYYRNIISYLGDNYINQALYRHHTNRITIEELADYLDIKPKSVPTLEEYMSRR